MVSLVWYRRFGVLAVFIGAHWVANACQVVSFLLFSFIYFVVFCRFRVYKVRFALYNG